MFKLFYNYILFFGEIQLIKQLNINYASYDDVLCDDVFCDIFDACFHLLMFVVYLLDIHMLNLNPALFWSPPDSYFYQDAYPMPTCGMPH